MLTNAKIDFFHFLVFQGALCVTVHKTVGQIAFRAPFRSIHIDQKDIRKQRFLHFLDRINYRADCKTLGCDQGHVPANHREFRNRLERNMKAQVSRKS